MTATLEKTVRSSAVEQLASLPSPSHELARWKAAPQRDHASAQSAPVIEFDPALMESVVTRAITNNLLGPAGFDAKSFHAESDPLYRVAELNQRAAQFRGLYARWFRRGQFDVPFADALAELPNVAATIARTTITAAASRAEERADLAAGPSGKLIEVRATPTRSVSEDDRVARPESSKGVRDSASVSEATPFEDSGRATQFPEAAHYWLGISIQPSRLLDRPLLRRWLRHELWHIRDMLDPAFEYHREDLTPASGPGERLPQRVVQDRYSLLWSLSIDARIERAGLLPLHSKDERLARLAGAFPGLAAPQYAAILESIGDQRCLRHPELLELARWPRKLLGENADAAAINQPIRGSACPLCRFPTFVWADVHRPVAQPVVAAVQQAYPGWTPDLGICHTCFDLFSIRSGIWV
jgi:hypothetical protein